MKRLLALILVLLMVFSFVGCNKDDDKKDDKNKTATADTVKEDKDSADKTDKDDEKASSPALYKVTDDKGNVVWLFGSIHVGREDYYPLPSYVMDAYNGSDALAVECDIIEFEKDTQALIDILTMFVYKDGSKITDHIDKDVYDDAVEILKENGLYNSYLDVYIPAMWSTFIDECSYTALGVDMENGIDKHLLKLAKKEKKEVLEVESVEFQYQMMADYSPELQAFLLESSVEQYNELEEGREVLDKMMDAWVSGDEEGVIGAEDPEEELETEEEKALYEEYNNAMIVERNLNMADYAEEALKSGKEVFICVGAAHVFGDGAVAQLLKDRGYTVERVR